jgi:hypothetical protein
MTANSRKRPTVMMFSELKEYIKQLLRALSRDGYIYLGRTGAGLSGLFRTECNKRGTIKALEEMAKDHDLVDRWLLEILAVEGPRWVGYDRITEQCEASEATQEARREYV